MIRVLLIEDDPVDRVLYTAFFQGIEDIELVGCVGDGLGGLEGVETHRPHLVLLDLVMPSLTGVGLLQRLSDPEGERPVVLVTSRVNTPEMVSHVLELGATFYLLKPVNFGELPALIRRLCAKMMAPKGVEGMLQAMGGRSDMVGFRNACVAAKWLAQSPEGEEPLMLAYHRAAKEGNTSVQCVEKNIRVLVKRLMMENTPAWQSLWEVPPEKKPTNGIFLRQVANKLRDRGISKN